mgnify:CR=1 FL=1|jgi:hypothetical protein|tara:strand:+ start:39 stop:578 length:540 start_codon:yes stop_codon:yes gene_type:complete
MATFYLVPDGTTGTNNWTCSTGSDFVDLVDEDDDSTYIWETRQNGEINYTFANPSIAEENIDFDEDVTVSAFVHAHYTEAGASVSMTIQTNGTGIVLATPTVNVDDSAYPAYSGTSGTTKSFGTAWDYAGLQNLQMLLKCTGRPARFEYLRVSYVFFRVDYTAAVAVAADNATFFGTNF